MEFLLRTTDGEPFDLSRARVAELLAPSTLPSSPVAGWGDHRIEVEGVAVAFSFEEVGIQVLFEGEIAADKARRTCAEILARLEAATGQRGRVVDV